MPITKPNYGQIDFTSPLSRGLVAAFPFFENAGATNAHFLDQLTGLSATLSGTATPSLDKYGKMVQFNGEAVGGGIIQYTTVLAQRDLTKFSLAILFSRHATGGGNAFPKVYMLLDTASGTAGFYLQDDGTGGKMSFVSHWSTTEGQWDWPYPSVDIPVMTVITYDATLAANVPSVYVDGLLQTLTTITSPAGTFPTGFSNTLTFGNHPAQSRTWNGKVGVGYYWNRILTQKEAMLLSSDPFTLFRHNNRRGVLPFV